MNAPRALARKMLVMSGVFYAEMSEYRAEIVLWSLAGVMPLLLMGVWMTVSAATPMEMTPVEFARYFFAVFIVGQFTTVWVVYEFENEVVEGTLSPYLLQPIDPGLRHLAKHFGERLTRLPIVAVFVVIFFAIYPQAWRTPSPMAMLNTAVCLTLAFTLRFLMQYTIALTSFWIERASAIEQFTYLFFAFLGGRVAPLRVYPDAVRQLAWYTPFPYIVDLPATLVTEVETHPWPKFGVMAVWIVGLAVVNRVVWRLGIRRYSGQGA